MSKFYFLSDVVSNDGQFPSCTALQNDYLGSGPICRYAEDPLPLLKIMAGPNADKYIWQRYKPDNTNIIYLQVSSDTKYIFARLSLFEEVDLKKLSFFTVVDD